MSDLDEKLERMQADGRITPHDADEVRNFADFLAVAGPPMKGPNPRIHAAMHQPDGYVEAECQAAEAHGTSTIRRC